MEMWLSKTVSFNPAIISESDRTIRGIATSPVFDRENELITQEAVAKALDDYLELPVITVQHMEFPVGWVTKAEFDDMGRLVIEANIKRAKSCDDIWALVKSGVLNSFSIAGRRTDTTCDGSGRACVTKGLHINAITICGDNRCNPEATFEIVKALGMTQEEATLFASLYGDNTMEDNKVGTPSTTSTPIEADSPVAKSDGNESLNVTIMGKLDELTKAIAAMSQPDVSKCSDKKDDKKSEETKMEEAKKATDMDAKLSEMSTMISGMNDTIKALSSRIETLENTKIEKAVVTIDSAGNVVGAPSVSAPVESYAKYLYSRK